ncbi:MAG: hypothetical protein R6U40_00935 [Desulfobacterales bacterium]
MHSQKVVTPVDPGSSPGGVQMLRNCLNRLDSGFRRNDGFLRRSLQMTRLMT